MLLLLAGGLDRGRQLGAVPLDVPGLATPAAHRRLHARVRVFCTRWDRIPAIHAPAFKDALHLPRLLDLVDQHRGWGRAHCHCALAPGGGHLVGLSWLERMGRGLRECLDREVGHGVCQGREPGQDIGSLAQLLAGAVDSFRPRPDEGVGLTEDLYELLPTHVRDSVFQIGDLPQWTLPGQAYPI